ncbi:MAG TPA: glycoside hydrolase family 2 TIM barrel-domain containing protein, partial [Arachidicoccus sp.]|nr:glycoside hydrolase family 2 TIM barrel-domain containing protein [Arachidicoccus sp.]
KLLKEMGCNAIRTAHNPPAPGMLSLCDSMGFLVMDEAFDMWKKKKTKYDYSKSFEAWHKRDLEDQIKRDRNHPSVFLWSVGNEIREQFDSSGTRIVKELVQIVKALDSTRPVMAALTEMEPDKNFITQAGVLDLLGFNYKSDQYDSLPIRFPGQKFIASETTSALETRGVYDLGLQDTLQYWPSSSKHKYVQNGHADWTVTAYDAVAAYWGTSHEKAWLDVKKRDFMSGIFVWTGMDYLGEPVPYPFPARSSYYGIIDLAGLPKDVYYLYQSEWTDKPVLHVFPHWNWQPGQLVNVWAYYSQADEVELFLNGKSLGKRRKGDGQPGDKPLHVSWKLPFAPGELKAVSRKNGVIVLTKEIKTAGPAAKIEMSVDQSCFRGVTGDLCFVTVRLTDANGVLVPDADRQLQFNIEGPATLVGVDNGYQADLASFKRNTYRTWKGKCVAIIRPKVAKGSIELTLTSKGLPMNRWRIPIGE